MPPKRRCVGLESMDQGLSIGVSHCRSASPIGSALNQRDVAVMVLARVTASEDEVSGVDHVTRVVSTRPRRTPSADTIDP